MVHLRWRRLRKVYNCFYWAPKPITVLHRFDWLQWPLGIVVL
jgi:hypothetical protein